VSARIRCDNCGMGDDATRAGWMCRTCGTVLPSARPDAKATAIAAKVARDLGCADLDDVPDALKRVLVDNADAEIHRRVLTEQVDAHRTRAEAAEAECARLRGELAAVRSAVRMLDGARAAIDASGQRVLRSLAGEERAALLGELAAARRERGDWNARATAMESERDEARAQAAGERELRREHGQRIGWAESVAAAAMRQGLDALTLMRERRERLWARVRAAESDPMPGRSRWIEHLRTLTRERDEARAVVAGRVKEEGE
jgi:hypothetical protein